MRAREMAAWAIAVTGFWVVILTPPRLQQVAKEHETKVINLGAYDDETNTFTLPDGRLIVAPITDETRL